MSHTRHTRSTLPNPELHADERNDSASTTALQPSVALGSPFPPPPPSGSAAALHSPAGSAAGHPKASQRVGGSNRKARRYTMQQQEGDNMHLGTHVINATAATKKASRNTPYTYGRRASAPSVPSISGPQAMSMQSGSRSPSLRSSQQAPRGATTTRVMSPVSHSANSYGSLPASLPLSLLSIKQESSPSPVMAALPFDGALDSGGIYATSLPITIPSMSHHLDRINQHDGSMNQQVENWLVLSKESARQITDSSTLAFMDHAYIVTFQPYSYYTVLDAEVGQHKWFRAQACTCASYKYGFDKVRRPATIRDHLAKQPCAPSSLARLANIQLTLMRNSSKRLSQASVGMSDRSSSQMPPMPDLYPLQSQVPYVHDSMQQFSFREAMALPQYGQAPTLPYGILPEPVPSHYYPSESLEMSRSWPSSSQAGASSPFFGWSTDSEHASSAPSMSANNSDLGSLSGISTNTFSILQYTLNMNNLPTRSFSGSNNIQTYSFDESGSHSNSDLYTWPGVQNMFDTAHDASKASESPLFGTEESLFSFDDM